MPWFIHRYIPLTLSFFVSKGPHYVALADLELRDPLAFDSRALGLRAYITRAPITGIVF